MQFLFIILGIVFLGIFIYIANSYQECFTNFSNKEIKILSLAEIDKINDAYEEIKKLYYKGYLVNSVEVSEKKDIIKKSIAKIVNLLPNSSDKMNINNIYYGSTSDYGIRKYLNQIDDKQFNDIITQLKSLYPNNDAKNNEINNIINNYNDIKLLYNNTNNNTYISIINKKKAIESAFNNLKAIVSSKTDKQKIDIIYTEISPFLNTPNDAYMLPKLEDLKLVAPNSLNDIKKIKNKYEELKSGYNNGLGISSPEIIAIKNEINKIILEIRNRAGDTSDIDKLDIIYYGEAKDNYGIIVYLDEIDDNRFSILIKQIKTIINNLTDIITSRTTISDDIDKLFSELNDLYKDVYINKITTYDIKKEEIENKNRLIYSKLLLLIPVDKLHNTEIILILNTTLKRAYETNNITDINSLVSSFKELIKALVKNSGINTDIKKNEIKGISNSLLGMPIEEQVIPLKITIQGMKDDFNNIYNSFDLLNTTYKNNYNNIINFNNVQKKQLESYNAIINGSLSNIINYYPKNPDYVNKITSIKNVIIKPILEKELQESYRRKDEILISNVRTRFYNALNEIKNLIINNYGKTTTQKNINICLNNIIEAISSNKYPIKISNVNGCHKSLFDNKDLIISPKMFISENNGIIWKPATQLDTFKKTGINNNPYLYNYELASSSDNGINWNMIR
jgi:hypothetical protein